MGKGAGWQVAPIGQAARQPGGRHSIAQVVDGSLRRLEPAQFIVTAQRTPAVAVADDSEKCIVSGVYVLRLHGSGHPLRTTLSSGGRMTAP